MKIYTSYFGNKRLLEENGIVMVGICLYRPKFFSGYNLSELAPSRELFAMSDAPDEVYVPKFIKEVLGRVNARAIYDKLASIANGKDVALCCYEKENTSCHRKIVAEWLSKELGMEVKEFFVEIKKNQLDLFE